MNGTDNAIDENEKRRKTGKYVEGIEFWYRNYGRDKNFNPEFAQAMARKHKRGEILSDAQFVAIERIYNKWVKV